MDFFNDDIDENLDQRFSQEHGLGQEADYEAESMYDEEQAAEYAESYQDEPEMTEDEVLSDARLRLEQGRLYEMLMSSSLFSEMEADPRAIKNVEREIKGFIKERLEVMLGIRQDKAKARSATFEEDEIVILKGLVARARGQTRAPTPTPAFKPAPATQPAPSGPRFSPPKPAVAPPRPAPQKAAPKRSPVVARNQARQQPVKESAPLDKPVYEMNETELMQRNEEIAARTAARKAAASGGIPMPSLDQEHMIYQAAEMTRQTNTQGNLLFNALQRAGKL